MESYRHSAQLLRALAHPIRLRLLDLLCADEQCVCHLTAIAAKRQAYISQQLAALRRAGLVEMRKEGLRVYYRVRDRRARALLKSLGVSHSYRETSYTARACDCPKCVARRTK